MAQAAGLTDHLELLGAYAAGAASPGVSLLVASHLTLRPESRTLISAMEDVGGALLAGLDEEPASGRASGCEAASPSLNGQNGVGDPGLSALFDRIDAIEAADQDPPATPRSGRLFGADREDRRAVAQEKASADPVPNPVLDAIGTTFDRIPWRRRLGGLHEHVLTAFEGERVSLLRARPGVRIPHHTHSGAEVTLVLSGALKDDGVVMTAGDLSLCGPEDDHHPEIIGNEVCYCLVVVEGALRFRTGFAQAFRRH